MSRPKKGTPEWELWVAAIEVAIYPPTSGTTATAKVAWHRINALRAALDELGIDWRSAKATDDVQRAEDAKERYALRTREAAARAEARAALG